MERSEAFDLLKNAGLKPEINVPLKRYTTWRTGGPAEIFLPVRTIDELKQGLKVLSLYKKDWFLIGRGSNLLVSDKGPGCPVLVLTGRFRKKTVRGQKLICGAGVTLAQATHEAAVHGLTGIEALSGIPGTVGGAVCMNASAFKISVLDRMTLISYLDTVSGEVQMSRPPWEKNYRNGPLQTPGQVVLSAEWELNPAEHALIRENTRDFARKRKESQPKGNSAGSVFRNPVDQKAWSLIEKSGMRGKISGGARVSTKHANFILTGSGACSRDIHDLIRSVQSSVLKQTGVRLETEVEMIGEFEHE